MTELQVFKEFISDISENNPLKQLKLVIFYYVIREKPEWTSRCMMLCSVVLPFMISCRSIKRLRWNNFLLTFHFLVLQMMLNLSTVILAALKMTLNLCTIILAALHHYIFRDHLCSIILGCRCNVQIRKIILKI